MVTLSMHEHILWAEIKNKPKIKNEKKKVNSLKKKKKWYGYHDLHLCQWNLGEVVKLKSQCQKQTKKWGLEVLFYG